MKLQSDTTAGRAYQLANLERMVDGQDDPARLGGSQGGTMHRQCEEKLIKLQEQINYYRELAEQREHETKQHRNSSTLDVSQNRRLKE